MRRENNNNDFWVHHLLSADNHNTIIIYELFKLLYYELNIYNFYIKWERIRKIKEKYYKYYKRGEWIWIVWWWYSQ